MGSVNASSKTLPAMALHLRHHRFSLESYEAMIAHGILGPDDRVELLAGEIADLPPIGSAHASCVRRISALLWRVAGDRAVVSIECPLALSADSQPQPDVALLQPRSDFYESSHPGPNDTLLVIEISDSSLQRDRTVKRDLYADAAVPVLWIVDLQLKRIHCYSEPRNGAYTKSKIVDRRGALTLRALGLNIHAADFF